MTDASTELGLPIGTLVLTPAGHVPVERLGPGAMVLATSGSAAPFQSVVSVRRLRWTGPLVRVLAEALDDGTPQDDLLLTPGQGLLLDGALIAASALVDGHGIRLEPAGRPVELVQVVLGGHDVILAAGAAVEAARPHPDAPDCAPRREPEAALRAMLSWRAERLGWAATAAIEAAPPEAGTLRDLLEASPLSAALPLRPLAGDADTA